MTALWDTLKALLLPPTLALLLCIHLGYAFSQLALPDELRPYRRLLMPLVGCALFLTLAAALTTLTGLTPPWIAAGLAALALPMNGWAWWLGRRTTNDERRTTNEVQAGTTTQVPSLDRARSVLGSRFLVLGGEALSQATCVLLAALVFALAILPPLRWGAALPIGSNWDAAEFYVPLGRALQLSSQRDLGSLGVNPLVRIFTTPPVEGRIHAFSYLHAVASSAASVEPLRSYPGMMALALALQPLAVYPLGRALRLPRWAAGLATALAALAWLPLWVAYNSFSNHLMSLPLLPLALAAGIVALRQGGRRAMLTGGLLVAALATVYYPAMTAYAALFGPAALYMIWRSPWHPTASRQRLVDLGRSGAGVSYREGTKPRSAIACSTSLRGFASSWFTRSMSLRQTALERSVTPSPHHPITLSPVRERLRLARRLLGLVALSCLLSGPAQVYFFLHDGFLQEMLKTATGFQVAEFVSLTDALGLTATFNREAFVPDMRLVAPAAALALLLGLLALLGRRAPILSAMCLGAALYQGYTAARAYHYGFYKGITFEIPIYALLIAAGASLAWDRTSSTRRHDDMATRSVAHSRSPGLLVSWSAGLWVSWSLRALLAAGLALLLGLSAWTAWGVQRRYSAAGPQLWTAAEADVAEVRAEVPAGASVLLEPPRGGSEVFNSLLSYALLGHDLLGQFKTGYGRLDAPSRKRTADLALLPDVADPAGYGYDAEDARWAGAGMRLYARALGVRFHRAFGDDGRYPELAPGASLTLRLGDRTIALPDDSAPPTTAAGSATLSLAIASFGPTEIEIATAGDARRYSMPGGLVRLTGAALALPAEVRLHNTGASPAYLWWGELGDLSEPAGLAPRDDVFARVTQAEGGDSKLAADIQLYAPPLPDGPAKLTAIASIAYTPGGSDEWREIGQWVFFPSGGRRLRLAADPATLKATLDVDGRPADLVGESPAAGDGDYQVTLLFASNARIVYRTALWTWHVQHGQPSEIASDSVTFDVVPLPRPVSRLEARSIDAGLRLRGYTLLRRSIRPGERLAPSVVWQSLRKLAGDLRARLVLRAASGQVLAEQTLPLGAAEHGTSTWQEGEIAEQPFELAVPQDAPAGRATLGLALLGPTGEAIALEGGAQAIDLVDLEIVR